MCGLAPSRVLASLNYAAGGWESATVRVLPTSKIQVVTGTAPHGQGHETAWSMIAADRVRRRPGRRRRAALRHGHRPARAGHLRLSLAARRRWWRSPWPATKVIDKARQIAAHQMEANEDDLEFARGGSFRVCRVLRTGRCRSPRVAFEAFTAHDLPDGLEPNLEMHESPTTLPTFSWPFGTHMCAVEIDTETGDVRAPAVRRRRRLRQQGQPAHRRRPGSRRRECKASAQALYEEARLRRVTATCSPRPWPSTSCLPPAMFLLDHPR